MNKSSIIVAIYACGIIFGALFFDIWSAKTNLLKPLIALSWTILFLVALVYTENK
tara:strand:+ start:363 stop:527 length:165 start_codon:yes stop_codon:yes gene_type:complete